MRRLVLFIAVALFHLPAAAETFERANKAFVDGDFETASQTYEALLAKGIDNEDVYYNLGNAYFRLGDFGKAIFNFERALKLSPGMPDASYNLEVARSAVAERVRDRLKGAEAEAWWIRATKAFTTSELTVFVLLANLVFFALMSAMRFLARGYRRSITFVVASFVGLALTARSILF